MSTATHLLVVNQSWLVSGTGAPEGKEAAPVGSLYLREDGSPGACVYVKETGTGPTGWKALGQAAMPPLAHHLTHEMSGMDAVALDAAQIMTGVLALARMPFTWVNVPFNVADFTATGGTWTVAAGNINDFSYLLLSPTAMLLSVNISNTGITTGAMPLRIKVPGGKTATKMKISMGRLFGGKTTDPPDTREMAAVVSANPTNAPWIDIYPVRYASDSIGSLQADRVDVQFQIALEVN